MKYFKEWSPRLNYRKGKMLDLDSLERLRKFEKDPGYCSVYSFDEASAKEIEANGTSKGMDKYPVYTDKLWIDLDTGLKGLSNAESKISGYRYNVYNSGGKGFHIEIFLDKMYSGTNVPYSQMELVKKLGIECDLSLYQSGRLISMVGRIHPTTGRKKEHELAYPGAFMTLEIKDPPKFELKPLDDSDKLKLGLAQLSIMANNFPGEGNRYDSQWKALSSLKEGGISYSTALDLVLAINNSWPIPRLEADVIKIARQIFNE
jgi:hypothetical protein